MSRTIRERFWSPILAAMLIAACGGGAPPPAGSAATGRAATPASAQQTPAATPAGQGGKGMTFHVVVGFGPDAGTYDVSSSQDCFYDSRVSWSANDAISDSPIMLIDVLIPLGTEAARNINHVKILFGGQPDQVIYITSDKQPPSATVDDRGQTATLTLSGPAQQTGSGPKTGQLDIAVTCDSILRGG